MRREIFHRRRAGRAKASSDSFMIIYLNLVITLVPVLFSLAVFSRLAIVELQLPKLKENPEPIVLQDEAPSDPGFSLTVAIKERGMAVSNGAKQLAFLPNRNEKLDFDGLSVLMQKLKKEHPNKEEVVVLSLPQTLYEELIAVMDACRSTRIAEGDRRSIRSLFPNISLGEAS